MRVLVVTTRTVTSTRDWPRDGHTRGITRRGGLTRLRRVAFALCGACGDRGNVTHSTWTCYDRSRYLEHPRRSSAPRWLSPRPSGSQRRPSCCLAAPCLQPCALFALSAQRMDGLSEDPGMDERVRRTQWLRQSASPAPLTRPPACVPAVVLLAVPHLRRICIGLTAAGVIDVGDGQPALALRWRHSGLSQP